MYTPTLILKPYQTEIGGGEYRCFIRNGRLLAITQRDIRAFYHYMTTNMKQTAQQLSLFITEKVIPSLTSLNSFVLDLHLGQNSKILVIDVNPYSNCYSLECH